VHVRLLISPLVSRNMSLIGVSYNIGAASGNIIGPLLFKDADGPLYKSGLRACIGLFGALVGCVMSVLLSYFLCVLR
jgi:hypothetical protein